jgi:hypothetical protein
MPLLNPEKIPCADNLSGCATKNSVSHPSMDEPKYRGSTTDGHRFTRMIKRVVGLPGLARWVNDLKFIFRRGHRRPSVAKDNSKKFVGFGVEG